MQIRPTILIPIKPSGGAFWTFVGLLFLAWLIIRADPDYRSEEDADEREVSLKFKRNRTSRIEPRPPPQPSFIPDWVHHPGTTAGHFHRANFTGGSVPVIRQSVLPETPADEASSTGG